ncbi:hypothetical protein BGZ49_009287 [Haplosporangium sp. Z 27]|nr:hypothetical protein BGZ49_009287 [Haplosporangium sp. Z 27]
MDANTSGGPIPRNGPPVNNQMRPPPGNVSMNPIARPQHPNQRPPPHQQSQQQLQPPGQNVAHGGRSPILSPFQKQDSGAEQQQYPNNPNFRQQQQAVQQGGPNPVRPPNVSPGSMPAQRPPMQQQQPRPNAPPTGQQPNQFVPSGRPMSGVINSGSQGQLRPGAGSPQTPPSQVVRPPMQGNQLQQQPPQAQHPTGGPNLRPSASHPNLSGGGGGATGNRFTPSSPNLTTRSPQIRPLQASPQHQGSQGSIHLHQQQQHQQQQHQQHPYQQQHPATRPSISQTNLALQPGVRPPPAHGSPVQPPQVRPPNPATQHQMRPRPPQTGPQGQGMPQQATPERAIQLDIPSFNDNQLNGGQAHQQPQQRPPGARPIPDQTRQQAPQNQPIHSSAQAQGQAPQNLNPTQRQPQRPPTPLQAQPSRLTPPQRTPTETGLLNDQNAPERERQIPTDIKTLNGEHARPERHSPQQQHVASPNQRMPNAQQSPGTSAGHQQYHSQPGPTLQSPPPRPYAVPGSPSQKPLGTTEVKVPGPTAGAPLRPQQQYNHVSQPPQQFAELESIELKEPDAPLSDMDDDAVDGDDIEGGSSNVPHSASTTQANTDRSAPVQASSVGGPPAGPPRGPPRKLSGAAGTGPVRIIPPSNNPSSPPPNAFPSTTPPRTRVRPPPGNKVITPYRPPERPSQAPVMYSQSGQPTLSQPFPQTSEKSSADQLSATTTSMVPQGADSVSSSIRPKDGGLQKRVFAGSENNTSKSEPAQSPSAMAPPSSRLHDQKGPAILSASGRKTSPSALSSIKKWTIRGGLLYLGYTAVFSCSHNPTGVKGYYCKATNGLGGLAKPFVAPHYNKHLGPHVDRYVKPVIRQGHRVYVKVADPVVQGAVSVAGSVYESTAKKHVDSAKDQVISILPFKSKLGASKDKDQAPGAQRHEDQIVQPEVSEESSQSANTPKPQKTENAQHIVGNEEGTDDSTKETKTEEVADDKKSAVEPEIPVAEAAPEHEIPVVEANQQQEEEDSVVESSEEKAEDNHVDEQSTEHNIPENNDHHEPAQDADAHQGTEHVKSEENVHFKRYDTGSEEPVESSSAHEPSPVPEAFVEPVLEPTLTAADEEPSTSTEEQEYITQVEQPHESATTPLEVETAESTPEFADRPTGVHNEEKVTGHPTEVPDEEKVADRPTEVPSEEKSAEPTGDVAEKSSQPVETSAEDATKDDSSDTIKSVEEEHDEGHQQAPEDIHVDVQDQRDEEKEDEGNGQSHHSQGQDQEEEGDLTSGQQAAPVSETEHEGHPKSHDEL